MAKRKKFTIPKMTGTQSISFILLNILAFLLMGATSLNTLLGLDWNEWLVSLVLLAASGWLMSQGGIKVMASLKSRSPKPEGILHVISFAVGLVVFFIGVTSLPFIGSLVNLSRFAIPVALVLSIGMIISIWEIFV